VDDVWGVVPGGVVVIPRGLPWMRRGRFDPLERDGRLGVVGVEHESHGASGSFSVRFVFGMDSGLRMTRTTAQ
jgi:hypothetical protein